MKLMKTKNWSQETAFKIQVKIPRQTNNGHSSNILFTSPVPDKNDKNFNWIHVMLCAIWYHLNNFKNVKNTHRGPLLLVKLQALLKVTLLQGCFSCFLNVQMITNRAKHHIFTPKPQQIPWHSNSNRQLLLISAN